MPSRTDGEGFTPEGPSTYVSAKLIAESIEPGQAQNENHKQRLLMFAAAGAEKMMQQIIGSPVGGAS
jgi:hypothetical protein